MKYFLPFLFCIIASFYSLGQPNPAVIAFFNQNTPVATAAKTLKTGEACLIAHPERHIDGSCNNMNDGDWGKADIPFYQMLPPAYGANAEMTGQNRKSARLISNLVCHQAVGEEVLSERGLSSMVYTFFQFIDHNITATMEGHSDFEPIPVPANDAFFDPNGTGTQIIPFMRSMKMMDENGMPHQMNALTSWLDGAGFYGSDAVRANWLRTFQNGKLKTSSPNLLPCNTITGDCNDAIDTLAPFMAGNKDACGNWLKIFVAGDVRANEQPGLLSLHTLFMREHNKICSQLILQGFTNDELMYQKAKRRVIGEFQAIVFNELLPALGIYLDEYSGYDDSMRPDIYNVFATAAFRLGHTMVTDNILLLDNNCQPVSGNTGCGSVAGACDCSVNNINVTGSVGIKDAFFHPSLVKNFGIDPILKGLTVQTQQKIDAKVVSALRNFLFGVPGNGGLDLVALNIQRGRDHGLPDYNTIRQYFTGNAATTFAEITSDVDLQNALAAAYDNDINNIDAFIGLLCEEHLPNVSVGATLHAILKDQLTRLRNSDRYFYKIDPMLSETERAAIHRTTLTSIIERNTSLNNLSPNLFYARACANNADLVLYPSTQAAYKSTFIDVPILVENFQNIYELDAQLSWDASQLTFEQVVNFTIPNSNPMFQNTANSLQINWSDYQNAGKTLGDGNSLMVVRFKVVGNVAENAALGFVVNFAASTAGNAPLFQVNAQTRNGNIHIKGLPAEFKITGMITTPFGEPAEEIKIHFLENNQTQSDIFPPSGQTTFEKPTVAAGADIEFFAKSEHQTCAFCPNLSVLDAVLLKEHLLGNRSFLSPYSYLAADIDENNILDNNDLEILRSVMLRKISLFPIDNYRFFSTDQQPTLEQPFDIKKTRERTNINQFLYAQNFMAVPKGQILHQNEFAPKRIPIPNTADIFEKTDIKNATVSIPIAARNFGKMKGFQLTLAWDATVLEFVNFQSDRLTDLSAAHFDLENVADGKIALVWLAENGQPLNVLEGEVLLNISFKLVGENGSFSDVRISDALKTPMVVTENLEIKHPVFDVYRVYVVENVIGNDNIFQLAIFPNPTVGAFYTQFQLENDAEVSFKIVNSLGVQVQGYQAFFDAGLHQLSFEDWQMPVGMYFISMEAEGERVTKRILKVR